jgi:mono/diheme cytochrome c family protein
MMTHTQIPQRRAGRSILARARARTRTLVPAAALALAPALSLLCSSACRGDYSEDPPIHWNPNMDEQARLDPQEDNTFFANHRAMRKPVPGTVARGQLRLDTHLYRGRIEERFAAELPDQVPATRATFERGRRRFAIYCASCHGPAGYGNGVVYQRQVGLPKPASFHDQRLRAMELGQFVYTVVEGKGNMQKMDRIVPARDRWAIAAYVRALQLSQGAPSPQTRAGEVSP